MVDCHLHDDASSDATGSLAEHARAAARAGLSELCVTNHVESLGEDGTWRLNLDDAIRRLRGEIRAAERVRERWPGLTVRIGAEFEYRPEWTHLLDRLAAEVPLDFIIGSVHRVQGLNISGGSDVDAFFGPRSLQEAYGRYFREIETMVAWGGFDVVGHFDLVKRYGHGYHGPYDPASFESEIRSALRAMAASGIGLEINTSGVAEAPGVPYPEPEILRWAREAGIRTLTIGSDSHAPDDVGRHLDGGMRLARRSGWEELTVFERREPTTVTLDEIDVPVSDHGRPDEDPSAHEAHP